MAVDLTKASGNGNEQQAVLPRLSLMMFLEFFVWGSWFVTIGVYLTKGVGFPEGMGTAYGVGPLAAIASPLLLGLFADRYLPTQVALGICHLLGAGLLWFLPQAIAMEQGGGGSYFWWTLFGYMLLYMPTLGLTNTLALSHIRNSERDFPVVRVFGTIGWIVAGLVVGTIFTADATTLPFKIGAISSVVLGIYSFTLPHTPPPLRGKKVSAAEALGLGALRLFKSWHFAVFAVVSVLLCIPLQAYYAYAATYVQEAGFESGAGIMIWGQVSEIVFMLLIPFFFRRLGVKVMLAIGMACWALRYGLFAIAAPEEVKWMIVGGILLHGICYDFFFVTGQIYTDRKAPKAIRGQAQGLLVVLTQGIGMWLGAYLNQHYFLDTVATKQAELAETGARDPGLWADFWWMPAMLALGILVLFVILFKTEKAGEEELA